MIGSLFWFEFLSLTNTGALPDPEPMGKVKKAHLAAKFPERTFFKLLEGKCN